MIISLDKLIDIDLGNGRNALHTVEKRKKRSIIKYDLTCPWTVLEAIDNSLT